MRKILIVEDDKVLNKTLAYNLTADGYEVTSAYSFLDAVERLKKSEFDIALLDINLPDGNGLHLCDEIRGRGQHTYIMFITANDKEGDMLKGYEAGCTDYITKPFSLSVLRARVNTQLRKAAAIGEKEKDNEHVYRKEPYVFDFDRMKFMVDGKEIELSKTEQKLLRILVENAGMNMRRELLLDRVWSDGAEYVDENALSVSVKRLRDKLGAEHAIRTVYGIGYRWE